MAPPFAFVTPGAPVFQTPEEWVDDQYSIVDYMFNEGAIGSEYTITQTGGTVTYSTTRGSHDQAGVNSLRINRTATTRVDATRGTRWGTSRRVSGDFWLWSDSLPTAEIAIAMITNSVGDNVEVRLGPTGALKWGRQGGASSSASATLLANSAWYRISWAWDQSTTAWNGWIAVNDDPPIDFSWTAAGGEAPAEWVWGSRLVTTASLYDLYYDDARSFTRWFSRMPFPVPVVSGTTYFQTIDAAGVGAPGFVLMPGKVASVGSVGVPVFIRDPARIISLASSGVPVVVKQPQRALTLAGVGTPTLLKVPGRVLTVAGAGAATMIRSPRKVLSVAAAGSPTFVRFVTRTLTLASSAAVAIIKQPRRALTVASTSVATIATSLVKLQTLTVAAVGTPTIVRMPLKVVSATSSSAVTFVRFVSRIISRTATGAPAIIKQPRRTLTLASSSVATIVRSPARTLTLASTVAVSIVKRPARALSAVGVGASTIVRQPGKVLSRAAVGAVSVATLTVGAAVNYLTGYFGSALARIGLTTSTPDVGEFLDPQARGETDAAPTLGEFDPPTPGGTG